MGQRATVFGSLDRYEQGSAEVISGDIKHYAFSNIFAVAATSAPFEKVVVGKNLEYVLEAIRVEGTSGWFACSHDEFVLAMDGEVEIQFVKLDAPDDVVPRSKEGTIRIAAASTASSSSSPMPMAGGSRPSRQCLSARAGSAARSTSPAT